MADRNPPHSDRYDRDRGDRERFEGERYRRDDRGVVDRAGDEVRSWFGDEEAARRRRIDENERERWSTPSRWGDERSYSSNREYGDREYGWRDRASARNPSDRDFGPEWPSQPTRSYSPVSGSTYGRFAPTDPYGRPEYSEYDRESYGGPYARERFAAGEWSSPERWRVPGPFAGRGPRGYQRSDERVREEVCDRLTAHGRIDATDVECQVQNGEVTLRGFVDSRTAKRAAEDVAEDVAGVREVHNEIRVRSHAGEEGVGRTSVLGLTESQTQTSTTPTVDAGRSRTRS